HTITAAEVLARRPAGLIFSGGPASVHADGAPSVDPAIYETGVPILGLCYGAQLIARDLGGEVAKTGRGEYGRTGLRLTPAGRAGHAVVFGDDLPAEQSVWMSHFDTITGAPAGFTVTASTDETPAAAFEDAARGLYGVQFHPEVAHTPHGQD